MNHLSTSLGILFFSNIKEEHNELILAALRILQSIDLPGFMFTNVIVCMIVSMFEALIDRYSFKFLHLL